MRDSGGMTIGQLAIVAGRGESDFKAGLLIRDVLARRPFGQAAAEVLEAGTGVQARLWLRMETRYREDLAMGRTESPEDDDASCLCVTRTTDDAGSRTTERLARSGPS